MHAHCNDPHGVNYLVDDGSGDAVAGTIRVDWPSLLWNGGMAGVALIGGPLLITPGAIAIFILLTGIALLLGHSIGYHRLMIHGSFQTRPWLARVLIWCGAFVGMAGPLGIIRAHDRRDWAQRQTDCHPYFAHRTHPLRDAWWQIYCRLDLDREPRFDFHALGEDPFIRWLEHNWRWQQLPVALVLYALGGWAWMVWGMCARVAVATHGHWLVGHLAHTQGPQNWLVDNAGVQAHDVPWAAIPTMGEAWHNNHHAWPGSARIGDGAGQSDWGYAVIYWLKQRRLVWAVQTPETLATRAVVRAVEQPRALGERLSA